MVLNSDRKILVSELADLLEEEKACERQYRSEIDEAQRVRLKGKLNDLGNKIRELDVQLHGKDLAEDANRRFRALEEKLPKIDFKKQMGIVKNILEQFTEDGAALFFINDSLNMANDRKRLQEIVKKHYQIRAEAPPPSDLVETAINRFLNVWNEGGLFKKPGTSEFLDCVSSPVECIQTN